MLGATVDGCCCATSTFCWKVLSPIGCCVDEVAVSGRCNEFEVCEDAVGTDFRPSDEAELAVDSD